MRGRVGVGSMVGMRRAAGLVSQSLRHGFEGVFSAKAGVIGLGEQAGQCEDDDGDQSRSGKKTSGAQPAEQADDGDAEQRQPKEEGDGSAGTKGERKERCDAQCD